MKKFYKVTLPAITLLLSLPTHGKSLFSLSKPASEQEKTIQISRIVGGEQATQGDWPWMTALVSTDAPTSTSLTVGNTAFVTESFSFAPEGSASGELAECGLAGSVCGDVEGKVCLIERGEFNFSVKADNCQAGGGIGAIIYNNVEGNITNGTMGSDFTGTIPVVAISQADGQNLLNQLGESASLSVTILPGQTQDSSCGATFLGDKWVLTAAHCVDEPFSRSLQLNVGEHNLADGAQNAIGIRNIFIHPQYDAPTIDYDIAIIELTESVDAPAVKLANASTTDQLAQLNSPVTVIGWGGRLGYQPDEGPTGDFPDILHQTELSLQTNQQCRETFSQSQGVQPQLTGVSDVMICADFPGGGRSACQGDSGGPLLANTNEGWQQVGIVSWGVGCAADGYPGVYTRVAAFNGWVQAITQGVSLVNPGLLPNIPLDSEISTTVDVMNNTEQSQSLSFSSSSSEYSISPDQCLTLAAGETCSLTVTFSPQSAGFKTANLSVTTETSGIETENIVLSAISLSQSSAFDDVLATDSNLINWYSGGDNAWVVTAGGGIESGTIGNTQDSILLASIEGAGELTFEWSVSSEDNTDDPDDPFDALYLIVNGEDIEFISGDVPFTSNQVSLNEGTNLVEWTYNKDLFTAERQDKGFLRNVVFTPEGTTTPPPQPSPPPAPTTPPPAPTPSSSGGSGGALSGFILLLVPLLIIRRRLYPFYLKMLSFSWR